MPAPVVSIFETGDYDQQIGRAVSLLREGSVIVLPTETVYGAAGLLTHHKAIDRLKTIRNAAGGTASKPLTIHLSRGEDAMRYIGQTSEIGQRLMRKLWPGPVALVFNVAESHRKAVAKELKVDEAELFADGAITLRCPDHIVAIDVIDQVEGPIALTVAGRSPQGPGNAIASDLGENADLILDAGPTRFAKPSTILRVKDKGYEIVRSGVYDERIIERLLRTTILFICSGNTCRSPMAESIARVVLAKKLGVPPDDLEKKGVNIISAGAFALPGARATPQAVEAVKSLGADLTKHRSRPLTVELIHQSDVIFTMSRNHAAAVLGMVPSARDKTMTLDPDGDIEDPIGGDLELYQQLATQMHGLLQKRLDEKVSL